MTCYLSPTDWRDVLYNAVRRAPGGVAAAAAFLTQRRGRSMHPETLRGVRASGYTRPAVWPPVAVQPGLDQLDDEPAGPAPEAGAAAGDINTPF